MNVVNATPGQDMSLSTALLSLSQDGILVLTAGPQPVSGFKIIQANTHAEILISGLTKPLIGAYLHELPVPFSLPSLNVQLKQVSEQPPPVHFNLRHPSPSAGSVPVYACQLVKVDNHRLVLTFRPAQLQPERKQLLEQVVETMQAGLILFNTIRDAHQNLIDFEVIFCNQLGAGMLFQALEGRTLSQFIPPQISDALFDRFVTVAQTGASQRFEWSNPTGTIWYDLSVAACLDGIIVTFTDITASKLAQLEEEKQADLLKGVLNSSANSILVLEPMRDTDNRITDFLISLANPATIRLFLPFINRAFSLEELQQQSLLTIFPAVRERALFNALVAVVNTKQSIHTPIDYPTLGLIYEYDIRTFRSGVLMITTDITPLRVYQQQLEAKNIALSRSNEYLQQFAYVASHDLQEPLRKIHSFGDILLTQHALALNDTGQDILRRQQNAVLRMQLLIRNLLDYSRLTIQQSPFQPVSLQLLVRDVLSDLETTIRETNARVTIAEMPTIPGDGLQLRQLVQNLITNSLKFTKPNEAPLIRLDAFLLTADQLPESEFPPEKGQWVALRIADEGIGFNETYRERIFELFNRLHGRSQYIGTGIGLAVVKKVVENHRGLITAQSQPGAGATFTVYLPMTFS